MKSIPVYKVRDPISGTPYMVVRFIGAGGMGSVYEVEDTSVGKRYVLKTLNVDFAKGREASGLEQMMRREARALAQVAHPHIVDVITAGKTSDRLGLPYIVMEKLEGVTVRTMLQSLSFPRQSVWQIANELLDALYHLHHPEDARPPMLHRDIKPENIFLAKKHDKKYVTKLLDLGIAVMLDGQAHGVHGTPSYMAPEQFRNEPLSEHTDLYQAACVIFEMLTGRHPFYGARSAPEWIEAHLWRDPPRASELVDVPKRVDDVLFAALSKLPSKRPRDAHALMAGLHELRDGSDAATPIVANTTLEDLHTAIEKRGESGYLAYATGTGTIEGVTSPPIESNTLEDAYPSFGVASTEAPGRDQHHERPRIPAHKWQTVPMGRPQGRAEGRVDRSAPTRSARELVLERSPQNDTEELGDSEMSARSARRSNASGDGSHRGSESSEGSNATPFAAEVATSAITGIGRSSRGRRRRMAVAASVMLVVGGLVIASAILRSEYGAGDRGSATAGERSESPSQAMAATSPTATPAATPVASATSVPTASASPPPPVTVAGMTSTPTLSVSAPQPASPSATSAASVASVRPSRPTRATGAPLGTKPKPGASVAPAASRTDYGYLLEDGPAQGRSSPSTPPSGSPSFDGELIRTF